MPLDEEVKGKFEDIGKWAKTHKPVVIGAGVGGLGLLVLLRRKSSGSASGPASYLTPDMLAASPTGSDVLTITGGQDVGGGAGSAASGGTNNLAPTVGPTAPFESQPLSSGGSLGSPTPSGLIGGLSAAVPALQGAGPILNSWNISNPYSSLTPTATYTPSASDILSTEPGGLNRVLLAVPGGPAGASYTVDTNSQLGSGPVVPVSARIAGERYDASGRVIA